MPDARDILAFGCAGTQRMGTMNDGSACSMPILLRSAVSPGRHGMRYGRGPGIGITANMQRSDLASKQTFGTDHVSHFVEVRIAMDIMKHALRRLLDSIVRLANRREYVLDSMYSHSTEDKRCHRA